MKIFSKGKIFSMQLSIDADLVKQFCDFSGDYNPIHLDLNAARRFGHPKPVAHGAILISFISKMIGTEIPGSGAVWLSQNTKWLNPIYIDDRIKIILKITGYSVGANMLTLETIAFNQNKIKLMEGEAKVKVGEELSPNKRFLNKNNKALVTGGSGAIGHAVCRRLASSGYDVFVIFNRHIKEARELKKIVEKHKVNCELIKLDLTEPVSRWKSHIKKIGKVDIFVHCASSNIISEGAENLNIKNFRDHIRVGCESAMEIINILTPSMIKNKFGRLIFIGTSALKDSPQVGWSSYLMAKHALWGYVKNLSIELGPKGITANMISPSLVVTNFTADIPHRAKEVEARKNPTRRLAVPEDISETIGYLCQDQASFINGQNIFLTGGS
jgi:3-oxoacyl-[acyl-carrier protein] reductase